MKRRRRALARGVATIASAALMLGTPVQYAAATGAQAPATDSGAEGTPSTDALPSTPGSSALGQWRSFQTPSPAESTQNNPHQVLVVLDSATQVTGGSVGKQQNLQLRAPLTSNAAVNTAFQRAHAVSMRPLLPKLTDAQGQQLHAAAQAKLGSGAIDLSKVQVVQLAGGDATAAARMLAATPGVTYAEPDRAVSPMNTGAVPLPSSGSGTAGTAAPSAPTQDSGTTGSNGVPGNAAFATSMQSFLNAGGVNATGAYSLLKQKYNQLPGAGETITNVSIGDLTDSSTPNLPSSGPTTVVQNGQRYLDIPTMPLIPTYTSDANGVLDPTGSTLHEDPALDEVLMDFSVMAPLPHELQRPGMQGSGNSDLLGIAPGANYRLVVPQEPTFSQIAVALLAAAQQSPRPDVITASLGVGTDSFGLPGRYLEDDPVQQAAIAAIVQQYGITLVVSANDGTRLFTNASIGPDGGSTPTDVAHNAGETTTINDDQASTTPTKVLDSGAIAAGATTADDTLSVPPQSGAAGSGNGTWATTRLNGAGIYSSGFGTRVDVSAPGDDIPALQHRGQTAQSVVEVLNGGTSASAPEIAAAAAVVLQTSRLTGQHPSPDDVRSLLERTGRAVATPPQIDRPLHVGPQVDVTAAVQAILAKAHEGDAGKDTPQIVRLSVAHRQTTGGLGGQFMDVTDPGRIDLAGPGTGTRADGEGLVGPVTIGADVTGLSDREDVSYALRIGDHEFTSDVPAVRLTPSQMLTAAGLPVVSTTDRQVSLTFEVRHGGQVVASETHQLTFGPTDGGYVEALAPVVQPVVKAGDSVQVSYDLTGVRYVNSPKLVVSGVGHWNPALAPIFSASYSVPLTELRGTVTVPASTFSAGGGIYGIGIVQNPTGGYKGGPLYGEFASVRVAGGNASQRPEAPTLAANASGTFGHLLEINRATPQFSVHYDVSQVEGAVGTLLEFSAPGPNMYHSYNMVSNQNGTTRDHDGVNSPATIDRPLNGTQGTADLDAGALKLPSSLNYDVRVFAVDQQGRILGQASPTSLLSYDDGLTPDGTNLTNFAIVPGGMQTVNPRISTQVQRAIERATQLNRDARYPTVDDFARDLMTSPLAPRQQRQKSGSAQAGPRPTVPHVAVPPQAAKAGATQTTSAAHAAPASMAATVVVQPHAVDFGRLVWGQRGTFSITIGGYGGARVRGQIKSLSPWLAMDRDQFDGSSTLIQLMADTRKAKQEGSQRSTLQIICDGHYLYVPVSVEIMAAGAAPAASKTSSKANPKSSQAGAAGQMAAGAKAVPKKYQAPAPRRRRWLWFAMASALGFAMAVQGLIQGMRLLAALAPHRPLTAPLALALLFVAMLLGVTGALAGSPSGGRFLSRVRTAFAGGLIGLLILLASNNTWLWTDFAEVLSRQVRLPSDVLLLAPALIGLGAALGADAGGSRLFNAMGVFIARYARVFMALGVVAAGGWAGYLLTRGVACLTPFGIVAGIILGLALIRALGLMPRPPSARWRRMARARP